MFCTEIFAICGRSVRLTATGKRKSQSQKMACSRCGHWLAFVVGHCCCLCRNVPAGQVEVSAAPSAPNTRHVCGATARVLSCNAQVLCDEVHVGHHSAPDSETRCFATAAHMSLTRNLRETLCELDPPFPNVRTRANPHRSPSAGCQSRTWHLAHCRDRPQAPVPADTAVGCSASWPLLAASPGATEHKW